MSLHIIRATLEFNGGMSSVEEAVPVWEPGVYGNPLLSAQFCCEPRTALKK